MDDLEELSKYVAARHALDCQQAKDVEENIRGKMAKIICPYFNDQPYGSSKPKLKGKSYEIRYVFASDGKVYVGLEGVACYVTPEMIEVQQ